MKAYDKVFFHFKDDLYHFAPIPFLYKILSFDGLDKLHVDLIEIAKKHYKEEIIEVPDVRHIETLGKRLDFSTKTWKEQHNPAVGVWHCVPTNSFLDIKEPPVIKLKNIIMDKYQYLLENCGAFPVGAPRMTESWIQFYKNGDYKVLHNHRRYFPLEYANTWAGAYYITDGNPVDDQKYAGVLNFRVRDTNYYIRPTPGLLVMWPGDVLHEVIPFYGSTERIVINFNISTFNTDE